MRVVHKTGRLLQCMLCGPRDESQQSNHAIEAFQMSCNIPGCHFGSSFFTKVVKARLSPRTSVAMAIQCQIFDTSTELSLLILRPSRSDTEEPEQPNQAFYRTLDL